MIRIGSIIRLHRLKIKEYKEEPQGQKGPGFAYAVFSSDSQGDFEPLAVKGSSYTITENDKEMTKELREWSNDHEFSQDENSTSAGNAAATNSAAPVGVQTLSDCELGHYFDLVCQVAATCVLTPGTAFLLLVWDSTKMRFPAYIEDTRAGHLPTVLNTDMAIMRDFDDAVLIEPR